MSDDVKRLWVIALPILCSAGPRCSFILLFTGLSRTGLEEGTISAVNFASKLTGFPQAIMMTAVTTVIYPLLSKKEGEGDMETIRALYKKGCFILAAFLFRQLPSLTFLRNRLSVSFSNTGNLRKSPSCLPYRYSGHLRCRCSSLRRIRILRDFIMQKEIRWFLLYSV